MQTVATSITIFISLLTLVSKTHEYQCHCLLKPSNLCLETQDFCSVHFFPLSKTERKGRPLYCHYLWLLPQSHHKNINSDRKSYILWWFTMHYIFITYNTFLEVFCLVYSLYHTVISRFNEHCIWLIWVGTDKGRERNENTDGYFPTYLAALFLEQWSSQ